jgi:phosphatidylserine/phosphatidylglycerophosphate/cardiolipin synthase-like enzyme
MRERATNGQISVQAVAGTHVVLLGMDVDPAQVDGLLGFAIERTDHTEGERDFLDNFLLLEANDSGEDADHSSEKNPFQEFIWGDYTAKPDHSYTYSVTAMHGEPDKLEPGPAAAVRADTESQSDGRHAVFFNRGVAASQAYAKRFKNQAPAKVPNGAAFDWLSRDLLKGMLGFIGQATDDSTSLRAAVYEFNYKPVLDAFKVAIDSGADVKIVYDAVPGEPTATSNPKAIEESGLTDVATPRTKTKIAHNKFVVLLRDDKPVEVWTGSTNITEGGIFGHSNVGHIVRDPDVAERYLNYWKELSGDPDRDALRPKLDATFDVPKGRPRKGSRATVFSPRTEQDALDWYVRLADSATQGVFLVAAFGLGVEVRPVFESDKPYLRYLLLDTEKGKIDALRRDPDNLITAGGYVGKGGWKQWIEEKTTNLNFHVEYVHLKFMLVDPLTDDPLVITGSANWSDESAKQNDENMLVVRGDTRLADIYLGEFMRLFNHFRLRGKAKPRPTQLEPGPAATPSERSNLYLHPDDTWATPFFVADSPAEKERLLFR